MSFLDGIKDFAEEHGLDEEKINQVKEMIEGLEDKVGDINIAEIAEKVGVPESVVEKFIKKDE